MEWQPIETAPKDGSRIIGWDGDHVSGTYFNGISHSWADESQATGDGFGSWGYDKWKPTRWMPLPEPP